MTQFTLDGYAKIVEENSYVRVLSYSNSLNTPMSSLITKNICVKLHISVHISSAESLDTAADHSFSSTG